MSASQMTSALNDYAATGLDIYISELDITGSNSESSQAAKYQELFPVIWNHPSVKGVTLWGYIVGQTWHDGTGIVNANGADRQAMTWLRNFLQPTQNTLTVAPEAISFGAAVASSFVAVTSNVSWNVTQDATWLTASPTAGTNNGSFGVSATANTGAARSGTVTLTGGNLARTIAVTQSAAAVSSDYSISTLATLAINRGASATATISIARTGGFGGSVAFSATGLPSGVTASFSPSATTANSSVLTLTAASTATVGAATVMITATSGTSSRSVPLALTVGEGSGGAGPVTVTSAVTSASPWFNEQQVRINHSAPLTALSVTVVIQRTPGLSVSGQYNTVGGQIAQSSSSTATTLTYQFTLAAGQMLSAGSNRAFAAQMGGSGTAHPTTGDTYTVTYTSGGQSFTRMGTF
jgi:hypothetical protein